MGTADLRDLLPAIEPDRHVDDWGRSERLEGLGKAGGVQLVRLAEVRERAKLVAARDRNQTQDRNHPFGN